ncbi:hypothetical protein PLICRDRAFT_178210 [Plicaturopsis crispa FD-325 SS-3]|nr:hypothetical protein PLICRDRAFT_178210 [Plicaturopsis crispa FD-325 SS-3]
MADEEHEDPWDSSDESDGEYQARERSSKAKRTNTGNRKPVLDNLASVVSFEPLLEELELERRHGPADGRPFEESVDALLPDYIQARSVILGRHVEHDIMGKPIRPLTRYEASNILRDLELEKLHSSSPVNEAMAIRKLELERERRRAGLPGTALSPLATELVTPLPSPKSSHPVKPGVLDALYSIQTTPYDNSFVSRLCGAAPAPASGILAVDWETQAPWMQLMSDIRAHHALSHPGKDAPEEPIAPIVYGPLRPCHLEQVHDLLSRVFWIGIDVSDSFQYSPERSTVVATYKKLVVGVAILSSPVETYITYLAVKAGWDNAQIATSMLYHLIMLNPNKDITLHVSTNNPAMILYNHFGFKAEEFVAGFYEDYLDPHSKASKNAFKLRLRR